VKRAYSELVGAWRVAAAFGSCAVAALILAVAPAVAERRGSPKASPSATPTPAPARDGGVRSLSVGNRFAYIPPACYTKTRDEGGVARNPCFVCHRRSEPPNFADDGDLQLRWSLPVAAADNAWTNLFDPPLARAPRVSDDDLLAYVRQSNYFDDDRRVSALARTIESISHGALGDVPWRGYLPDAWFSFDDRGFDHGPDGAYTGWRAFAYYPFPGTFFPANGSADDVLIRLDPSLQEDEQGTFDLRVYEVNLAIVEALLTRADVPIDGVDERAWSVDLDLDGSLGRATRVTFDRTRDGKGRTRMQYVGRAGSEQKAGRFPIAPGLLPLNTEFLHTVRYLDIGPDGVVTMAPRMKELRYAKKLRFLTYDDLAAQATRERIEQERSVDHVIHYAWTYDRGLYNGQGWLFQGFIEAEDGSLRPQSYEESLYCAGCHGGIGATTDSVFALPRKLGGTFQARGWFHWSQHDLRGLPEPRSSDGHYEYTRYLEANGASDELRDNREARSRFFDDRGALRSSAVERLHGDVGDLLLPSPGRALDLDRAYRAIVREQSFARGRDATLAPSAHAYRRAPVGTETGLGDGIDAK
jgi:hypothetical protein